MIDRYLKMNAVPPTNPPNSRSLRKFQAGHLWEWILGFVLKRAGILLEAQEWVPYQYPGFLRVTGKLDFFAGGTPDWSRARAETGAIELPEFIATATRAIIDHLEETFGDEPLKKIVLEAKSVSSFMYDRYEYLNRPALNHQCQIFHYLKAKQLPEGHLVYVCKDDCRVLELGVFNPSAAEVEYKKDLETITYYIRHQEQPAKEKEVLFDNETFTFRTNWAVEYSNYLTRLYGFKEPIEYRDKWDKPVAAMNRVFKRCVAGAKMTDLNLKVIEGARRGFPQWDDLVSQAREALKKNPKIINLSEEAA